MSQTRRLNAVARSLAKCEATMEDILAKSRAALEKASELRADAISERIEILEEAAANVDAARTALLDLLK